MSTGELLPRLAREAFAIALAVVLWALVLRPISVPAPWSYLLAFALGVGAKIVVLGMSGSHISEDESEREGSAEPELEPDDDLYETVQASLTDKLRQHATVLQSRHGTDQLMWLAAHRIDELRERVAELRGRLEERGLEVEAEQKMVVEHTRRIENDD